MTAPAKPLPTPTVLSRPFWDALRRRELHLQHCPRCDTYQHPPKPFCPRCHNRALAWQAVPAAGTVYSYTIVHRPPSPAFKADAPYVVALVDIDGTGIRLMGNVAVNPSTMKVGMPVRMTFDDVTDELTVFAFQPQRSEEAR